MILRQLDYFYLDYWPRHLVVVVEVLAVVAVAAAAAVGVVAVGVLRPLAVVVKR